MAGSAPESFLHVVSRTLNSISKLELFSPRILTFTKTKHQFATDEFLKFTLLARSLPPQGENVTESSTIKNSYQSSQHHLVSCPHTQAQRKGASPKGQGTSGGRWNQPFRVLTPREMCVIDPHYSQVLHTCKFICNSKFRHSGSFGSHKWTSKVFVEGA